MEGKKSQGKTAEGGKRADGMSKGGGFEDDEEAAAQREWAQMRKSSQEGQVVVASDPTARRILAGFKMYVGRFHSLRLLRPPTAALVVLCAPSGQRVRKLIS